MASTLTQHRCEQCKSFLYWVVEFPEHGTGCLIALVGLLLSPFLIGIPIMIYGYSMTNRSKRHWHCSGCGRIFPHADTR